ncbi:MAG: L,D-transpeptidase family protein, partial [Methylocapsa sp.]|nr:L,D-transpeptidase family protein [Methylocapsa sp.]
IYSVLQKEEEHYSNRYDDAEMPFMQRITWSGIALHAGLLPGYPASHGCIRMPHQFAEQLYEMTKIGMRVIVARNDVRPAEITHPALFKPKPVPAGILPSALAAHWENIAADGETAAQKDPPPQGAAESQETLRSIAAARLTQANAAARTADAARMRAAQINMDALRALHAAQAAKSRAEARLNQAESALAAAASPTATEQAAAAKSEALERLAAADAQLAEANTEAPLKEDAAAKARAEAEAAEAEKISARKEAQAIDHMLAPVSVFISRKTQRLYIRQAFEPVLEVPVTIRDAGEPIGTHVYMALDYKDGGSDLRWGAVTLESPQTSPGDGPAKAALDRIEIPKGVADRISEVVSPGSSLIISDEAMSSETGKETDFVVLLSSEPQGGIKMRHRNPEAAYARSYERTYPRYYERYYERPYRPAPGSRFFGFPFSPW